MRRRAAVVCDQDPLHRPLLSGRTAGPGADALDADDAPRCPARRRPTVTSLRDIWPSLPRGRVTTMRTCRPTSSPPSSPQPGSRETSARGHGSTWPRSGPWSTSPRARPSSARAMCAARSASSINGRVALRLRLPGGEDRTILTVDAGRRLRLVRGPAAGRRHRQRGRDRADPGGAVRRRSACGPPSRPTRELAAAIYHRLLASVVRRLGATRTQLLDLYRAGNEPW